MYDIDKNKPLTSRQVNAMKTKKILFNTAKKLFSEKGYYNVTIEEITKKAGTSKGTFYTHYKSKQQIIEEQFKQQDNHYLDLNLELSKLVTFTDKILFFIEDMYKYFNTEFELIHVIYSTQLSYQNKDTFIINENRPLYLILNQIIKDGQEAGEFKDDINPSELTKLINRSIRGTLYDWCLYNGEFDLLESGMELLSIIIEGIKNY